MLWAVRYKDGAAASQDSGRVAQHRSRSMQTAHTHAHALAREAVSKVCFSHGPEVRRSSTNGRTSQGRIVAARYRRKTVHVYGIVCMSQLQLWKEGGVLIGNGCLLLLIDTEAARRRKREEVSHNGLDNGIRTGYFHWSASTSHFVPGSMSWRFAAMFRCDALSAGHRLLCQAPW